MVSLLLRTTKTSESQGSKLAAQLSGHHLLKQFKVLLSAPSRTSDLTHWTLWICKCWPCKSLTSNWNAGHEPDVSTFIMCPQLFLNSWNYLNSLLLPHLQQKVGHGKTLAPKSWPLSRHLALMSLSTDAEKRPIPRDQEPLLWWKNKEQTFPSMSKLAKKYLAKRKRQTNCNPNRMAWINTCSPTSPPAAAGWQGPYEWGRLLRKFGNKETDWQQ